MKILYIVTLLLVYGLAIFLTYVNGIVSPEILHIRYIFLLPIGVAVSVIAMSSGISGSNFWIPIYVIVLPIEPKISFWLALFTMIFGFGSGGIKHYCQNTIKIQLVLKYLFMAVPGAVLGAMTQPYTKTAFLLISFGVFVYIYGTYLILSKRTTNVRNEKVTMTIAFTGGILKGIIATGIGEILLPRLIDNKEITHPQAVGTTVCIVFITNLVAVSSILTSKEFLVSLQSNWEQLFSIMVFVVPAVIVGGQIGPTIPSLISKELLIKYVGILLVGVSFVMIFRGFAVL